MNTKTSNDQPACQRQGAIQTRLAMPRCYSSPPASIAIQDTRHLTRRPSTGPAEMTFRHTTLSQPISGLTSGLPRQPARPRIRYQTHPPRSSQDSNENARVSSYSSKSLDPKPLSTNSNANRSRTQAWQSSRHDMNSNRGRSTNLSPEKLTSRLVNRHQRSTSLLLETQTNQALKMASISRPTSPGLGTEYRPHSPSPLASSLVSYSSATLNEHHLEETAAQIDSRLESILINSLPRGRTKTIVPISDGIRQASDQSTYICDRPMIRMSRTRSRHRSPAHERHVGTSECPSTLGLSGLGGHRLGFRQPERQTITPCGSPPRKTHAALHALPIPIQAGTISDTWLDSSTKRSASPRGDPEQEQGQQDAVVRDDVSFDAVDQSLLPVTSHSASLDQEQDQPEKAEVDNIEDALTDAMETSIEWFTPPAGQRKLLEHSTRFHGKRKTQEDWGSYPEKKGKPLSREDSPVQQGSAQGSTLKASVALGGHASAPILSRTTSVATTVQTIHTPLPTFAHQKTPSIDVLVNALEQIEASPTPHTRFWGAKREKGSRRGTVSSVAEAARPGSPILTPDPKASASLAKQNIDVISTVSRPCLDDDHPDHSTTSLTLASRGGDEEHPSKTCSVSLKRIQDDDMERTIHAYQTQSRSHSPASQLEAAYRSTGTMASNGMSWETLHRRNVLELAKTMGKGWLRGPSRHRRGSVISQPPPLPTSPSRTSAAVPKHLSRASFAHTDATRPVRDPRRSISYAAVQSPTQHVISQENSKQPAGPRRRQSGSDALLLMQPTRHDESGWRHYAFDYIRNKAFKHQPPPAPDASLDPPIPSPDSLPPVSIERWRQQLVQATSEPDGMTHKKSRSGSSSRFTRPEYKHADTVPLLLHSASPEHRTAIVHPGKQQQPRGSPGLRSATSPYARSEHDSEMVPFSACSASTGFDVESAYDLLKTEPGLVSFDRIAGLS